MVQVLIWVTDWLNHIKKDPNGAEYKKPLPSAHQVNSVTHCESMQAKHNGC